MMTIRNLRALGCATLLNLLLAAGAQAGLVLPPPGGGPVDLTQFGAQAYTDTASCPSFCTSFGAGGTVGGVGSTNVSNSFSDSRGNAAAQAILDPSSGLSLPILRAEAYVTGSGSSSAFGTAIAAEGYTYEGAAPKTFDLDITLTGEVFDPTPGDGDTDIEAQIYIFGAEGYEYGFDAATLIFELGVVDIASAGLSLAAGETSDSFTLSFTLDPGQSVFLQATLGADAERDLSFADSFSTLTTSFQDPVGLVAASTVPEPGTFALVVLGLAGVARSGRRRR